MASGFGASTTGMGSFGGGMGGAATGFGGNSATGSSVGYGGGSSNAGTGNAGYGGGVGGQGGVGVGGVTGFGMGGAGFGGGAATGGGGGTAAGGSSPGVMGGTGGLGSGLSTFQGPAFQALLRALLGQQQAGQQGPPGFQNLGVPPGVLSGVQTATTPVTVSALGSPSKGGQGSPAPGYSPAVVAQLNQQVTKLYGNTPVAKAVQQAIAQALSIGPGGIGSDAVSGGATAQAPATPAQLAQNPAVQNYENQVAMRGSPAPGYSAAPVGVAPVAPATPAQLAANPAVQNYENQVAMARGRRPA
jgi:hypothetical protein